MFANRRYLTAILFMLLCASITSCSFLFGGSSNNSEEAKLTKEYGIGGGNFSSRDTRASYRGKTGGSPFGRAQIYVGKLIWPVAKGRLTSRYGWRTARFHEGLDLAAPTGTPIRAAHSGKVLYSGRGFSGYGNIILIKGEKDLMSVYAHNRSNVVGKGQQIKQGQIIGYVGSTGRASGPHLHYELRIKNENGKFPSVDPLLFYEKVISSKF